MNSPLDPLAPKLPRPVRPRYDVGVPGRAPAYRGNSRLMAWCAWLRHRRQGAVALDRRGWVEDPTSWLQLGRGSGPVFITTSSLPERNSPMASQIVNVRSLIGGSLLVLQRHDGRVDRYVFDGRFRHLGTGARTPLGGDLGTYQASQTIPPTDDPDYQRRLSAFHAHLLNAGVTDLDEAPDEHLHAADLAAAVIYPWPKDRFS